MFLCTTGLCSLAVSALSGHWAEERYHSAPQNPDLTPSRNRTHLASAISRCAPVYPQILRSSNGSEKFFSSHGQTSESCVGLFMPLLKIVGTVDKFSEFFAFGHCINGQK